MKEVVSSERVYVDSLTLVQEVRPYALTVV